MDHSLINPNQIRAYCIPLWDNPFDPAHPTQIDVDDSIVIPLQGQGTKLQFDTRVPTRQELNECPHITMTSPLPWDPTNITKSSRISCVQCDENVQPKVLWQDDRYAYADPTSDFAYLSENNPTLGDLSTEIAIQAAQVSDSDPLEAGIDVPEYRTFVSPDRHTKINAETLAERFAIGPKLARATLKATRQSGTRSATLP